MEGGEGGSGGRELRERVICLIVELARRTSRFRRSQPQVQDVWCC